jgi:chromosomal replication initiation ATPase DnaA
MSVDPIIYQQEPQTLTPRQITILGIGAIAKKHGMNIELLMSKSRRRVVVTARNEAIRYVWGRHYPTWSYPVIGRFFGMDHTSIMYALGRLPKRPPSLYKFIDPLCAEPIPQIVAVFPMYEHCATESVGG